VGDIHVAEDAVQIGYVEMLCKWETRSQFSIDDNRKYLGGIVWRKIADHFRQWSRLADIEGVEVRSAVHVDHSDTEAALTALLEQLNRLPARRRAVAILYFLEELDFKEISNALGISTSTVRSQVQLAREQLVPYARKLRDFVSGGEAA
jgi:RNA polymerase sigma factor (sigma-70 family)